MRCGGCALEEGHGRLQGSETTALTSSSFLSTAPFAVNWVFRLFK